MKLFRTLRHGLSVTVRGGINTTSTFILRIKGLARDVVPNDIMIRVQKRYGDAIYGYVRLNFRTLLIQDVVEVTNDVLMELAKPKGLPTFDSTRSFRRWVREIAWRKALARKRFVCQEKRDCRITVSFDEVEQSFQDSLRDNDTPDVLYERIQAREALFEAIRELREDRARLGKLREFEAMRAYLGESSREHARYADAARCLGMTPGTFKKAVSRLREALRRKLENLVRKDLHHNATKDQVTEELRQLLSPLLPKPPVTIYCSGSPRGLS
jgi:RNA polymerase sigma factor (sigma-70 family)